MGSTMVRKILYVLILLSLALIANQVVSVNGKSPTVTSDSIPIPTTIMTGSVEVRISASQTPIEVTAAVLTISSVEIYLAGGWSKMIMGNANKFDLRQLEGLEQTVATANLSAGTYTQIRITIARIDVAVGGTQAKKALISTNQLSLTKNFIVSAKNTTVLVINFDPINSIDDSANNEVVFKPAANLLCTTPGNMALVTTGLPQGKVGVAYSAKLTAIGGQTPYAWSITMGDLPPGLSLDPASGIISGTPTDIGNYYFVARADDSSPTRKSTTGNTTSGGVMATAIPALSIQIAR